MQKFYHILKTIFLQAIEYIIPIIGAKNWHKVPAWCKYRKKKLQA